MKNKSTKTTKTLNTNYFITKTFISFFKIKYILQQNFNCDIFN